MQQRTLFGSSAPKPQAAASPMPVDQRIYTVSELNAELKFLLESTYPRIWVEGEISNFNPASSGHFYFWGPGPAPRRKERDQQNSGTP